LNFQCFKHRSFLARLARQKLAGAILRQEKEWPQLWVRSWGRRVSCFEMSGRGGRPSRITQLCRFGSGELGRKEGPSFPGGGARAKRGIWNRGELETFGPSERNAVVRIWFRRAVRFTVRCQRGA
jgi:hypothetical protein